MASSYGCFDRAPFVDFMWMQDGTMEVGLDPNLPATALPIFQYVPHRMAKNCVYSTSDLGQIDKKCIGCKWREDGDKK